MGDEDEAFFPQVQLPDTPDCRGLTAVLRLYDHARLENKRMGVVSSRPGWGVEEDIEKWEGVYLDTEDRVVALDVDGDPENRQAVLIGECCQVATRMICCELSWTGRVICAQPRNGPSLEVRNGFMFAAVSSSVSGAGRGRDWG